MMNGIGGTPSAYAHGHATSDTNGYGSPQATAAAALSQHGTPAANGRKRKASGAPGSRGVANLTPEQLAKKRANDREAQRAIRERTRNTIETLERRIRELESQQPFQELQRVMAQRDSALQECEDLKRKLATVAQVVGGAAAQQAQQQAHHPQQHGQPQQQPTPNGYGAGLNELAALGAQQSPLPPLAHHTAQQQQQQPPQTNNPFPSHGGSFAEQQQHVHPDLRSPPPSTYAGTSTSPISRPGSHAEVGKWSPSQQYAQTNGTAMQYDQQQGQNGNGERPAHNINFLLDSKSSPHDSAVSAPAPQASMSQKQQLDTPLYARLSNNCLPTCPLDSLLSDFISNRRALLASGASMQEVLGPEYPTYTAVFTNSNPPTAVTPSREDCHPVSALLIDILSKFPDISALPEKVAVLYIMFLLMRWSICPCEGCFARLPEWMRPVAEQLERPHARWEDQCPWSVSPPADEEPFGDLMEMSPQDLTLSGTCQAEEQWDFDALFGFSPDSDTGTARVGWEKMTPELFTNTFIRPFMRKQLAFSSNSSPTDSNDGNSNMHAPAGARFDMFFIPYTVTLSLNWPYSADQILTDADEGPSINPGFETHLRDLSNWSLGPEFVRAFPELVEDGSVRIE